MNFVFYSSKQGCLIYVINIMNETTKHFIELLKSDDIPDIFNFYVSYANEIDFNIVFLKLKKIKKKNGSINHMMGDCYFKSIGTKCNFKKAYKYYIESVKQGNTLDKSNLATMYCFGLYVKMDKRKAYDIYKKYADLECHMSQYNLALMYEHGHYVEQNFKKAYKLYVKSAKNGLKQASEALQRKPYIIYMIYNDIKKVEKLCEKYNKKSNKIIKNILDEKILYKEEIDEIMKLNKKIKSMKIKLKKITKKIDDIEY